MKIYSKLGNNYVELNDNKDVFDFIRLKILILILGCFAFLIGLAIGCFSIYFVLQYPDKILSFLINLL